VWRELERTISDNPPQRDENSRRTDNLGHLVIIVADNDDLIEPLDPLIEWKQRKGYIVTVGNMSDIGPNAADLRAWLLDAYEEWDIPPTFVLLAGDALGQGIAGLPYFHDPAGPWTGWASSDNPFVCWVDGENGDRDPETWIPEAFIGRLPATNVRELEHLIAKILGYEMEPVTDDPWVEGAVLIANGVQSCIHVNYAVREMMEGVGYDRDDIEMANTNYYQGRPNRGPLNAAIDDGVGFVNFRGYNNWGDYYDAMHEITGRRNGYMLPVVNGHVCGTNDFPSRYNTPIGEAWVKGWNNNNPSGGIACFGPTDLYTWTWFNNTLSGEFYDALLYHDVHTLGALCVASKLALLRNYPSRRTLGTGQTVGYYFRTYCLLGDPTMQVWTHNPQPIFVNFEEQLPVGVTLLDVTVTNDDDEPVSGAYIHIYNINEDEEETRFGAYSDEDGTVHLNVDPLEAGEYLLTITGPNLVPILESFEVVVAETFTAVSEIFADDDENGQSNGNDDATPNPGETLELNVSLLNTGEEVCGESSVTITTDCQWVEIEHENAGYPSIDPGEASDGDQPFLVHILPQTPDGQILNFTLTIQQGEDDWEGGFELTTVGYVLDVIDFEFDDDFLLGTQRNLSVEIENAGDLDAESLTGTLYCNDPSIQIRQAESVFGEIPAGETGNSDCPFEVAASGDAYEGSEISFGLLLADDTERRDSLIFTTTLGEPSVTSPQGPDNYGYWAFDNRDESSGMAPEYDWVEGQDELNINDPHDVSHTANQGVRVFVDLPFENPFLYYGVEYDEITVCSNGWLCFGRSDQVSWNNQELNSGLAPAAMLCPFWDDLWEGDVYTR
ncbi:MAG: C25 family cysteine peptidase, partial [Candidatus Electryoneaceae bacterium]|nr:C25 family cysteine peptidase [Candidatus Electryoneaceae bacterium]